METTKSARPPAAPYCAPMIVHAPTDPLEHEGEILVALWGANEFEIVTVREAFPGEWWTDYKGTGEKADPSEWQWWAELRDIGVNH